MKKTITLLFAVCATVNLLAQNPDAKDILRKATEKCRAAQNGYYEMKEWRKFETLKDTLKGNYTCYFKKRKNDTLSFYLTTDNQLDGKNDLLYNGNELIIMYSSDSTAVIIENSKWSKVVKGIKREFITYGPLIGDDNLPLPPDSIYKNQHNTFKYIGKEKIEDKLCYHVRINFPVNDTVDGDMRNILSEYDFWVTANDFIPIQYSNEFIVVEAKDTMTQYERFIFTKYEFNNLKEENKLSPEVIPSYYKQKDYYEGKDTRRPLSKDSIAPEWSLSTLDGKQINLKDLRGKLVLVDFFYKSCHPCLQALPVIEALYEKYKDKGLVIVGIDPYVQEKEELKPFLDKRGVTYTVLMGTLDLSGLYKVTGYPCIYIIGKDGRIIANEVGYGDDTGKNLEEIIKGNL